MRWTPVRGVDTRRFGKTLLLAEWAGAPVDVIEEKLACVGVVAEALNLDKLRVVETGGDAYATERQQWDSGNNLVAIVAR